MIYVYIFICGHQFIYIGDGLQVADLGGVGLWLVCLNLVVRVLRVLQPSFFRQHVTFLVLNFSFSSSRLSDSGLSAFRLLDSSLLRDVGLWVVDRRVVGLRVADRWVVGLRVVGRRVVGLRVGICQVLCV